MMRVGVALMVTAFALLVGGNGLPVFLVGAAAARHRPRPDPPGASAAASLAVEANEQGSVAGILGGVAVAGNAIGPMIGTALYGMSHKAPVSRESRRALGRLDPRADERPHPSGARLKSRRERESW